MGAAPPANERFEPLKKLIATGKFGDAERAARALLTEAGSISSPVDSARAFEMLSEAIWRQSNPRSPEARELAERAVAMKERALGRNHVEVAISLSNYGSLLQATGETDAGRKQHERALAIREKALGPDHPLVAQSLTNLGSLLLNSRDVASAGPMFQRALAIREKALPPDDPAIALSLNNIAKIHADAGQFDKAKPLYERALVIMEKAYGPEHPDFARMLGNLAVAHHSLADYSAARLTYERTLAAYEKAFGSEHPDVATTLQNYGVLLEDQGDYAAARTAQDRALAIREKAFGPDHNDVAWSLNNVAALMWLTGDFTGSRPRFERALAIWEKVLGPEHPVVAGALHNLANVLQVAGDYGGARPLYERALAIYEKGAGPDHPGTGNIVSGLGTLLKKSGDYAAARPLLERAVKIYEKSYGPDHPGLANGLHLYGQLLRELGDHAAARPILDRALAIQERALGPENQAVAGSLTAIGTLLEAAGDRAGARPLYERAVAIREKALGPLHPAVASDRRDLARLLHATGDLTGARAAYEQAMTGDAKSLGDEHPNVAIGLAALARVQAAQGDTAGALARALAAERISRGHLELTSRSLSEREALRYAAVRASGLDLALGFAAAGIDPASRRLVFDALVRSRAVVLDEMAARHRAVHQARDPNVARLEADLSTARGRLATLLVRGLSDAKVENYRKLVDGARAETEQAERALAAASASFARGLSRSRIGVDEVSASLPPGSALVAFSEYARRDSVLAAPARRYLAFVLPAGARNPNVVDLGPAEFIDALVADWKMEASSPARGETTYQDVGARLRRRVWDPVAAHLAGIKRALIVPDGSLNLVNLAALPRDGGGYLVESEPILHYTSAERDLVPRGESHVGQGLLAVGVPSYDAPPGGPARSPGQADSSTVWIAAAAYRGQRAACGDFASAKFAALPGTGEESRAIVDLWKKYGRRDGAQSVPTLALSHETASETTLKTSAAGRRVLHLATHGFFIAGQCQTGKGTRGIGGLTDASAPTPAPSTASTDENPLRLSGLVFAGANQRATAADGADDGILTAEEIASLDLSSVEWAVLSACETGVGDVRAGEGVFGLRRAFQVAGAGTLIMSLWSVEDQATRAWMKSLYTYRLKHREDTAAAARRASIETLRDRRSHKLSTHPFYWAAFVTAGDWR